MKPSNPWTMLVSHTPANSIEEAKSFRRNSQLFIFYIISAMLQHGAQRNLFGRHRVHQNAAIGSCLSGDILTVGLQTSVSTF